jgi:hypothetical protein
MVSVGYNRNRFKPTAIEKQTESEDNPLPGRAGNQEKQEERENKTKSGRHLKPVSTPQTLL